MKLKKSERKLLEKRAWKLEDAIHACNRVDDTVQDEVGEFDAKFMLPSARYLSKVVDSLIERRIEFVNKDGSEIGGVVSDGVVNAGSYTPVSISVLETVSTDGVTCAEEPVVTEGNLVAG